MNSQTPSNMSGQAGQMISPSEVWRHLLQSAEARQMAIDAVLELFLRWHLHPINQATLLGLADISELNKFISVDKSIQVFTCIGHLLAIDRDLLNRYPQQADINDQWVWQTLRQLHNKTPMSVMLAEGLEGIKFIRYLLAESPQGKVTVLM